MDSQGPRPPDIKATVVDDAVGCAEEEAQPSCPSQKTGKMD